MYQGDLAKRCDTENAEQ